MPFPQVDKATTGAVISNSTSHPVTLPNPIAAGSMLIVWMAFDGNPTVTWDQSTAGTWTVVRDAPNGAACKIVVYYKIADGTEGGKILGITSSATEQSVWRAIEITGAHQTTAPAVSANTTATNANPDPASLTPSWGAEETLWFAAFANDNGTPQLTGTPANYANQFYDTSGGAGGCGLGTARRENAVATEDPGAFTINSSVRPWIAITVAIRPAPPPPPVTEVTFINNFFAFT